MSEEHKRPDAPARIELEPLECRVLGVLVEKAQTTPAQYPLTLNALVTGCNQLSNRHPVMQVSEERALEALDTLRAKGLVREVMLSGSRVAKYRHHAREVLGVETPELVVLAELLLRGAQTSGEIRSRASRMHPLESIEALEAILKSLEERDPALVMRYAPAPGSRAPRWGQVLCPGHDEPAPGARSEEEPKAAPAEPGLAERVERLEATVARLQRKVDEIAAALS
jgi:hypothetical protein